MASPSDFSPTGVYGQQAAEVRDPYDTGNEIWDRALYTIRDTVEGGVPQVVLTGLGARLAEAAYFTETEGDKETIWQQAKRISKAAAAFGFLAAKKVVSFVFGIAKRMVFALGRFIVRGVIVPLLQGFAGLLTTPIGAFVGGLVGAGALSYFLYRTFFKGQDADTVPTGEDTDAQRKLAGMTLGELLDSIWDEGAKVLGIDALALESQINGERASRAATPRVGATPYRGPATEGRPVPAGAGSAEKFKQVYREEFRALGFTDAQISGMLGSIQQESNFNVNAFNPAGGGMGANGVMQWRGARWRNYLEFRKKNPGLDEATAQAKFAAWEVTNDPGERSGYAKVKQTSTPYDAGHAHGQYVERAGAHEAHNDKRGRNGEAIHKKFLNQVVSAPVSSSTESAPAQSRAPGPPITEKPPVSHVGTEQAPNASQYNAAGAPLQRPVQFVEAPFGPLPLGE